MKDALGSIGGGLVVLAVTRNNDKLKADGMVLIVHAEPLAEKLVDCAKENEQVYKVLTFLMTSSVWGALIVELAGIAMAIASNHGVGVPGLAQPGNTQPYNPEQDMSAVLAAIASENGAQAMTPEQWFAAKGA